MFFNKAGLSDAVKKFVIVLLYVAGAGALTAIAEFVRSMPIKSDDVIAVAIVGLVNALLAFLIKWFGTKSEK